MSRTLPDSIVETGSLSLQTLLEKSPEGSFNEYSEQLIKVFGLSDFVARTALAYPREFEQLLPQIVQQIESQRPHINCQAFQSELSDKLSSVTLESALHHEIRKFRHLKMLNIACLDLLSTHTIEQSLTAVSYLADCCLNQALNWLYEKAAFRYGYPQEKQPLLVLGMGKLGGYELNFSSDIDLIFVYPSYGETQHKTKPIEHQTFFIKLAQKLISALHQTTIDGQAYRVDMRLRPLGESGPLVLPVNAFETYYQEQGRDWERFAMQKARILNVPQENNQAHIDELNSIIKPYVYRKYLDFTTLESLRSMKQLIESELKRRQLSSNIKLGPGGIREVEFYIQCHQLIHAGRITECQTQSIYTAMDRLYKHGMIEEHTHNDLKQQYTYLRKIEHYLQQFNDKQTQLLPSTELDKTRLRFLLNCDDYETCCLSIENSMAIIHRHFANLIEEEKSKDISLGTTNPFIDIWQLTLNKEEIKNLLLDAITINAEQVDLVEELSNLILDSQDRVSKVALGDKGKKSLNSLVPKLISEALAYPEHSTKEKLTLTSFSLSLLTGLMSLIQTIAGRTTYLDLLDQNVSVRQRLMSLFSKSSWIAEQIIRFPLLLDELLHPAYLQDDNQSIEQWREEYIDALRLTMLRIEPDDIEAQMDALRYFKITQQMRIAAADITAHLRVNKVSDKLTILAEVLLSFTVEIAWKMLIEKHGRPQNTTDINKHFAIIAYGKMGGYEMGYGSDIDMVCIHDSQLSGSTGNGAKHLKTISNSEFYVKLVQKISHICTAKTYLGQLFEIDLRLRPSGNSGLLISHIDTFEEYQLNQAWTWEHQALTRSRCVLASEALQISFKQIKHKVLTLQREQRELKTNVDNMRHKMRAHLDKSEAPYVDIKQCKGGITDLEFIVQFLVLLHAKKHQSLTNWSDNLRLIDALIQEHLLSEKEGHALQEAYLQLRNKTHALNLQRKTLCHDQDEVLYHLNVITSMYDRVLNTAQH